MPPTLASVLVGIAATWLAVGAVFSVPFLAVGAGRIDPLARTGSLGFKLTILPGVVALWPVLLLRWLRVGRAGPDAPLRPGTTPHDRAAHSGSGAR